jgi:hypothetical protein
MDGLTMAASVIQLVDFASRLVAKGVAIHGSSDGLTVGHRELEGLTDHLTADIKALEISLQARGQNHELTSSEKQISIDCQRITTELPGALDQLKAKGPKTKWKFFRQALKSTWHDEKVQAHERRLDRFRQQLITSVLGTLR